MDRSTQKKPENEPYPQGVNIPSPVARGGTRMESINQANLGHAPRPLTEPLLDPANGRVHLLPIIHHDFWAMYQLAKASFWTPEEVDLSADDRDWAELTPDVINFLELNFAFFVVFDQIVIKNLDEGFVDQVTIPEVRMFYHLQEMMEDIHVHMYGIFPERFVKDSKRKTYLLNAVSTIPAIGNMAKWAKKWSEHDWAHRLVAFIIVEGIFFSGAFASIFFMKKQGKMPGLCQANELIARDEAMHRDQGMLMYSKLVNKLPEEELLQMIDEAVELTVELSTVSIPVDMIGMNGRLMKQYIQFVANGLALDSVVKVSETEGLVIPGMLGRKIYEVENPFTWMTLISLQGKTNFFDAKVSQYSKAAVLTEPEDNRIDFDAEF